MQAARMRVDGHNQRGQPWTSYAFASIVTVVGAIISKREMPSNRILSAVLGRSVLTHPNAPSADRQRSLQPARSWARCRRTPPVPETANDDAGSIEAWKTVIRSGSSSGLLGPSR